MTIVLGVFDSVAEFIPHLTMNRTSSMASFIQSHYTSISMPTLFGP